LIDTQFLETPPFFRNRLLNIDSQFLKTGLQTTSLKTSF
jgi:hypothetical protein